MRWVFVLFLWHRETDEVGIWFIPVTQRNRWGGYLIYSCDTEKQMRWVSDLFLWHKQIRWVLPRWDSSEYPQHIFYGEIWKIIPKLPSNTHLTCSSVRYSNTHLYFLSDEISLAADSLTSIWSSKSRCILRFWEFRRATSSSASSTWRFNAFTLVFIFSTYRQTRLTPVKIWTPKNIVVVILKYEQWFYWMSNSVDPDQTAPEGEVWSGPDLSVRNLGMLSFNSNGSSSLPIESKGWLWLY